MSDPFVTHRGLLFTVTYEMLSSAADAEDVVQEAWLRWTRVDKAEVRDPRAYLVRVVTRLALDRLRTLSRRREDYVGEWLPEPLLTTPDVAEDVELAENISIAMLTVLETLAPTERAVFVLRDVFGFSYDDIAESLAKSTVAVRQIAHRAREHIAARRPRMEVRSTEHEQVVETFMAAAVSGDLDGLLEVLAPDVVLTADGGGAAAAVRKPVAGAEIVARLLCSFAVGAHHCSLLGTIQPDDGSGEPFGRRCLAGRAGASEQHRREPIQQILKDPIQQPRDIPIRRALIRRHREKRYRSGATLSTTLARLVVPFMRDSHNRSVRQTSAPFNEEKAVRREPSRPTTVRPGTSRETSLRAWTVPKRLWSPSAWITGSSSFTAVTPRCEPIRRFDAAAEELGEDLETEAQMWSLAIESTPSPGKAEALSTSRQRAQLLDHTPVAIARRTYGDP